MQTHTFKLLFIGADCISFFFFFANNRVFSLRQYQTERGCNWPDYFYTHIHCTPTPSWQPSRGPTGPTAYKNVDGGRYFWPSALKRRACLSHRRCGVRLCPRCAWHAERRGGRWLTRGPSILRFTTGTRSAAGFTNVCYISMKGDGEEGRKGVMEVGCGGVGPPHLSWTENRRGDILVLDFWCKQSARWNSLRSEVSRLKCLCLVQPLSLPLSLSRVCVCVCVCVCYLWGRNVKPNLCWLGQAGSGGGGTVGSSGEFGPVGLYKGIS